MSLPLVTLSSTTNLNVWALVMEAGPMAKLILVVLGMFSVASWAIMAERYRRFRRAERESHDFLDRFHEGGGLAQIQDATKSVEGAPLADIFRAGFREISLNPPAPGEALSGVSLDAVDRVLRKNAMVQSMELERSLGFLATTASATPFIGLFGTVWGIMNAFRGIGVSGTATLAAYAPGIAEALVATAAGLFAAVPAVIGYNHFTTRLRGMESLMDEFIADFIHRVLGRRS